MNPAEEPLQPIENVRNRANRVRVRAYCFTANVINFLDDAIVGAVCEQKQQEPGFRYLCFQQELAPATGQRHYQGYVHFGEKREFRSAKSIIADIFGVQPHLEAARGTSDSNREYCRKADSAIPDSFREYGNFPKQGQRSDLVAVAKAVFDGKSLGEIAQEFPKEYIRYHSGLKAFQTTVLMKPRDRSVPPIVCWWFGPTGVGKSRRAFELYGETAYVKMNNQWWDGYLSQETVIIDDYRPSLCTFQELLRLIDRYPMRVQVKGSSVELSAKRFVFTTPKRPEVIWEGRTEEALNQLLRRITDIEEFHADGTTTVWKSATVPYVVTHPPANVATFAPLRDRR